MTDDELNALYPNRAAQIRAGNVIEASGAGDRQRESDRRKAGPWYKNTAGFDNPATWASLALLGGATVPEMFFSAGGAAGSGGSAAAMTQQISPYSLGMGAATDIANIGYDPNAIGRVSDVMSGNGGSSSWVKRLNPFGENSLWGNKAWDVFSQAVDTGGKLWGGSRAIGAGERSEDRKLDMLRDTLGMQYAMTGLDFDYNRPKMDMRNVALGELYTGIGGKPGGLNITPSGDLDPRKVFAQFPASQMGTKARG